MTTFQEQLKQHIGEQIRSNKGTVTLDGITFPTNFEFGAALTEHLNAGILKKLSITNCKLADTIRLSGIHLDELKLIGNRGSGVKVERLAVSSVLIVDNSLAKIEIMESKFEQLTFLTYRSAGSEPEEMCTVFLILNEINGLQISNQVFSYLHIALTNIHGTLGINNLKCDGILIRDAGFLSLSFFEQVVAMKYFLLSRCIIESPRQFVIRECDLSCSGFKGTDVSEINLIDNKWKHRDQRHIKILDHRMADGSESESIVGGPYGKVSLNGCAETYRQLKTNFERKGNYIDAGEFHYAEMEMRRLAIPSVARPFSIYSIYKHLSGYGENPIRALAVFVLALLSLGCLQLLTGFESGSYYIDYDIELSFPLHMPGISDFLKAIHLTFANFTLRNISSVTLSSNDWNVFLWIFETIFGPLQLALIALSIKRKVRR